jgi:hypothetical protein
VAGNVTLGPGAVGPFDGVDAEGQIVPAVEDPRFDDAFVQLIRRIC